MSEKLFIGVGHKARQGKDSFAAAIHREYPALTRVMGFADALKAVCRVHHGMEVKDGPLLQEIGVQMRLYNEDVWIRALYHAALEAPEPVIIIPDCRFENEAEFIKDHGGILVRVDRYTFEGRFVAKDRPADHESETALDEWLEWDYIVDNLENRQHTLREAAVSIFEEVFERWEKQKAMAEILREMGDDDAVA